MQKSRRLKHVRRLINTAFGCHRIKIESRKNFSTTEAVQTSHQYHVSTITTFSFLSRVVFFFLSSNLKSPLSDPLTLINLGSVSPPDAFRKRFNRKEKYGISPENGFSQYCSCQKWDFNTV